jgi:urate oxidase
VYHHLLHNSYGKSRVRLVTVTRHGDRHDIRDLVVQVQLEGDYEPAYVVGDNSAVLPTDTMKNTVYAFAKREGAVDLELFALRLAQHFRESHQAVSVARVEIHEHPWRRMVIGEKAHSHAFIQPGGDQRVVRVTQSATDASVIEAGIDNLVVLKSRHSGFSGFLKDRFTTLAETSDRILATAITATWRYRDADVPFDLTWQGIRQLMLETFAQHESLSVQHTLYAMADIVLENFEQVDEIQLTLPNRHHLLVDLSPFGLKNENEVFVPTDEPHGLIEATLRRRREM